MYSEIKNKRRISHKVLYILIILLLFMLALMYCRYQQVFTVKQIRVHGNRELSERQIIRISGIKRGAGMFDLDLGSGVKRLIKEPYIFNTFISRQFPDVINIHVIERNPVVRIDLRETYALDAFATVLPLPQSYSIESLPVIKGVDPDLAFEPGQPTLHPDIRHAINFVNYTQNFSENIREYCNHITWTDEKGWIIRKDYEHPPVYLGSDELKKRIDILYAFIRKMKTENTDMRRFKYVSLRFNDQVIVRD
ncbi:MAG: FtsQ-type POTRA domain-containing protein [Fidelibacterota bacterium]